MYVFFIKQHTTPFNLFCITITTILCNFRLYMTLNDPSQVSIKNFSQGHNSKVNGTRTPIKISMLFTCVNFKKATVIHG